jgi:DNA-binding NtrC family response regulator
MSKIVDVLIVDDDPNMTRTICDILAVSGFTCETALDAREGLIWLKRNSCRLVLTDIRMPGMNGVDFQQAIHERNPETRVILMTAYADYDLIARGRAGGALAFLDKPLNLPLLLTILRTLADAGWNPPDPAI